MARTLNPDYDTVPTLADELDVPEHVLRYRIRTGLLSALRVGNQYLVRRDESLNRLRMLLDAKKSLDRSES